MDTARPAPPPAAVSSYESIEVTNGGTIQGEVRLAIKPPKLTPRQITKNADICGHGPRPSQEIILAGGHLQNVVVLLEGIHKGKKSAVESPVLDQTKCDYVPHVQAVQAGAMLEIRNSDDILHNVHGYLGGIKTLFNIAMPLKDQKITKILSEPGVVHLKCDAGHTWMSAYIVVADNPYFTLPDSKGTFSIREIPPGTYKLKAWHEKLGTLDQDITITTGASTVVMFEFK